MKSRIPILAVVCFLLLLRNAIAADPAQPLIVAHRGLLRYVVRLAEKHKVLHKLLFIGRTITDPKLQEQIKNASDKAHTAAVANNDEEFPMALAVEWILLGNSPAANPNAIQIGMFCMWTTFCFGPRLLVRPDDSTHLLRRRTWQFFGAYVVLSTIIGLLIPAQQTRFVVIILVSVAAYIGMNVLLLWLMFRQHRNESTKRQVASNDDDAAILAEVVESAEAGSFSAGSTWSSATIEDAETLDGGDGKPRQQSS